MSRGLRITALLAAVGFLGAASVATAPAATAASDVSAAGLAAFADVAECAATSEHLLAAIVVDASGSLQTTDPNDERVGAVSTALDSLASLNAGSDTLDVQASLATFSEGYEELVGWGSVDGSHLAALEDSTTSDLPDRDHGNLTDYRAVLRGAQQSLDAQAKAVGGTSCKLLLWFTDGRLDVDGSGGFEPVTDAARADLCEPQGQIDGVRGDQITIISLALFKESGLGAAERKQVQEDQDRLQAIAEGTGGGEKCGTVPIPETSAGGASLLADDAAAMRRLFAQAAALIAGASQGESLACPSEDCVGGLLRISADRGIGGFRVILERDPAAPAPDLVAPDGTITALDGSASEVAGASLIVSDRDGLTTVDVEFPGAGSPGDEWVLRLGDTATFVDLYYFWGIQLDIVGPDDGLTVGETNPVTITPRHGDGTQVQPSELNGLDLKVTVAGKPARPESDENGIYTVEIAVPDDGAASSMLVEATARGTSAPNRIPLGPVSAEAELPTVLPPSYPTVAPSRLTLPTLAGDGTSTGTLEFTGSDRGDTRACLAEASFEGPVKAGAITLTPESPCVDIPANSTVPLTVEVTSENPADGRVDGVLPITLAGVDGADDVTVTIPVGMSMTRPVDQEVLWRTFALLLAAALALAWLTAALSRRVADRYRLSSDARVASVPVVVTARGVRRATADSPHLLDSAIDFAPLGGKVGKTSRFDTAGLQFRRRLPWFPLREGTGVVYAEGDQIVATTGGDQLTSTDGRSAPVQFPGTVGFVLLAEPPEPDATEIRGSLVMIVDSRDGVAAVLPRRLEGVDEAPWDRVFTDVAAASAVRRDAASKNAPSGRARPGADASVADPPPAGPPSGSSFAPDDPAAAAPSWADDPGASGAPIRSSGSGWADDLAPPPSAPAADEGKRTRRRRSRPAAEPPPPATDDKPGDGPPTSSNFWD